MSLLNFILIVASVIFFFMALDAIQRRKFNFIHILVFGLGSVMVGVFTLYPSLLDRFGSIFGVTRGADILVYIAFITLFWFYFILYNKVLRQDIKQNNIMRYSALGNTYGVIGKDQKVGVIMPTFRQGDKILPLVEEILKNNYSLIIVDDGYNNNLRDIIIEKNYKNVVHIQHLFNMGQGAALQTGQVYIQEYLPQIKYIVHFDSDGQHQVKDISKFYQKFQENKNLDIVFGSRFLPGAQKIPKGRAFHKKLQIFFMRVFVGIKLTDTNNGFRMIQRKALPSLYMTMNDYSHASEIEALVVQYKLQYAEVPVDILYDEEHIKNGQKLSNAFNIAKNIIYNQFFFK